MRSGTRTELGEAEERHRDQYRPKGKTVQENRPPGAHLRYEQTSNGWADHLGCSKGRGVQGYSVRKIIVADHLCHEGLPNGCIEGCGGAGQKGKHVDVPEANDAFDGEKRQASRKHTHRCLGKEQQPTLVQTIRS